MKKSEEREPISRHMGFSSSIASNNPHPHYNTGKQKERTKMKHDIEDEYIVRYQYINLDGSLGREMQQSIPLYCVPTLLATFANLSARIMITSCEKVSE